MKKQFTWFAGIDVSKNKLDVCIICNDSDVSIHRVFKNSKSGIKALIAWLRSQSDHHLEQCLVCLEHTGIYAMPVCCALSEHHMVFALVPAIEIQRSIGLKRGKSDRTDAKAIASYAAMRKETIRLTTLPEKKLLKLKFLLSHRSRLVNTRSQYQLAVKENEGFIDKEIIKEIRQHSKSLVTMLNKKIAATELLMMQIIEQDSSLNKTYQLLTSMPGIGRIIALQLIVATRSFTAFETSRKFACYVGIAPFPYQSGSSIRGRTKVSHYANKQLKSLLNLAALVAVRKDQELKLYYQRKLNEGKNAMLVLNNVRNKLVSRIFATVKRGTPFVQTMNFAA